jgi:hypothetical protein
VISESTNTGEATDADIQSRIDAIVIPLRRAEPDTAEVVRRTLAKLEAAGDAAALAYLQRLGMFVAVARVAYRDRYEQRNEFLGRGVPTLASASPARPNPRLAAAREAAEESLLDLDFGWGGCRLRDATYEAVESAMRWHRNTAQTNARTAALYAEILRHGKPGQTVGEFISDKLAERIKRKIYAGADGHATGEAQRCRAAAPASNNAGADGHRAPEAQPATAAAPASHNGHARNKRKSA